MRQHRPATQRQLRIDDVYALRRQRIECSECGEDEESEDDDLGGFVKHLNSTGWRWVEPADRDYVGPVCGACRKEYGL